MFHSVITSRYALLLLSVIALGWTVPVSGTADGPDFYAATGVASNEIFTTDRSQIYGILLHVSGRRYGPEFNGTCKSGWGEGQNRDF